MFHGYMGVVTTIINIEFDTRNISSITFERTPPKDCGGICNPTSLKMGSLHEGNEARDFFRITDIPVVAWRWIISAKLSSCKVESVEVF